MTSALAPAPTRDVGPLINNHYEVERLYECLRSGALAFEVIPGLLPRMISSASWATRYDPETRRTYDLGPGDFRRFIEASPPLGLGCNLADVRRYLGLGTPARVAFDHAIGEPATVRGVNRVTREPFSPPALLRDGCHPDERVGAEEIRATMLRKCKVAGLKRTASVIAAVEDVRWFLANRDNDLDSLAWPTVDQFEPRCRPL